MREHHDSFEHSHHWRRMNELHTVFDLTVGSNGVGGDVLFRMAIGIGIAIAGMLWLVRVRRTQAGWRKTLNSLLLVAFGAIWLAVTLPVWRKSEVTEGTVHVTHMQPVHGHTSGDRIIVGDRAFEIDYFVLTPGYRQTIAHGGALREGVYARLRHYDGVIIKVEVRP